MKKILLALFLTGLTVGAAAQNGLCFKPQVTLSSGAGQPIMVASADFNGDSIADFAITDDVSMNVHVVLSTTVGVYAAPVPYSMPSGSNQYPWAIAPADFNGDNKIDFAVSTSSSVGYVALFTNTGAGTFTASAIPLSGFEAGLASGDFD